MSNKRKTITTKKLKCVCCGNTDELSGNERMSKGNDMIPSRAIIAGNVLCSCSKCQGQMIITDVDESVKPDQSVKVDLMIEYLRERARFLHMSQEFLDAADAGVKGDKDTKLLKLFTKLSPESRADLRIRIEGRAQEVGRLARMLKGIGTDNFDDLFGTEKDYVEWDVLTKKP